MRRHPNMGPTQKRYKVNSGICQAPAICIGIEIECDRYSCSQIWRKIELLVLQNEKDEKYGEKNISLVFSVSYLANPKIRKWYKKRVLQKLFLYLTQ